MYGHDTLFLYFTRCAQQEQVAAINAGSPAAAAAHRTLSSLHAAKAVLAVAAEPAPDMHRVAAHGALDRLVAAA